ncbi:MAG: GNAT family N-acetyltransferase [Syntrophobacterales bacterium]|nr:GNAT family N-acetyltransferase [Syntrophobacterales bacterium]
MFGIGFEELLVLAVIAFILFGPERLPEYAAKLGRIVAKVREASSELSRQYQNPFTYPPEPAADAALPAGPEVACQYCGHKTGQEFAFCPKCGQRQQLDQYPPPLQPAEPTVEAQSPEASGESQTASPQIRPLRQDEIDQALSIINQAAQAYNGVIPADCWQEPYMPEEELRAEITAGVNFWVYESEGRPVGVMGRQDVLDVTLIRHAYVDPEFQRQGVGSRLLAHLLKEMPGPVLVGTWAAAWWAIRFYEEHGFKLVCQKDKDRLLTTYWNISPRQTETSVVLADPKWLAIPIYHE